MDELYNWTPDPKQAEASSRYLNAAFDAAPEEPPGRGIAGDMASGLKRGLFVGGPQLAGGAMKAFSPVESRAYQTGQELQDSARAIAGLPEMQRGANSHGAIGDTLVAGAEGIGQMAPVIAGGIINPVLGAGIAGGMYGGSAYQDTKERMLGQEGLDDAYAAAHPDDPRVRKAKHTGLATGVVQAVGDAAMTYLGGRFLKGAFPTMGKQTAQGVVRGIASPGKETLKRFGKAWGAEMVGEGITEAAQDEGQAAIERAAGLKDAPAFGEQALQSAQGGVGMALLLGPLAGPGHYSMFRDARQLERALRDPSAHPEVRIAAARIMGDSIATVDQSAAANFLDHAHDAIGGKDQTGSAPYGLNLDDPTLLSPFVRASNPGTSSEDSARTPPAESATPPGAPLVARSGVAQSAAPAGPVPGGQESPFHVSSFRPESGITDDDIPDFPWPGPAGLQPIAPPYPSHLPPPIPAGPLSRALARVMPEESLPEIRPVLPPVPSRGIAGPVIDADFEPVRPALPAPPGEKEKARAWAKSEIAAGKGGHLMQGYGISDAQHEAKLLDYYRRSQKGTAANALDNSMSALQTAPQMDRAGVEVSGMRANNTGWAGTGGSHGGLSNGVSPVGQRTADSEQRVDAPVPGSQSPVPGSQVSGPRSPVTGSRRRQLDPTRDDLVVAMARLGGLDLKQAKEQWGATVGDDAKALNRHAGRSGGTGIAYAFKSGGLPLDRMREALVEHGYLPGGATISDLAEAVHAAARGNHTYSSQADVESRLDQAEREWLGRQDLSQALEVTDEDLAASGVDELAPEEQQIVDEIWNDIETVLSDLFEETDQVSFTAVHHAIQEVRNEIRLVLADFPDAEAMGAEGKAAAGGPAGEGVAGGGPVGGDQKPGTGNRESGTGVREPVNSDQEAGTSEQRTGDARVASLVPASQVPEHVVNAVDSPRDVPRSVSLATKQQTKDTLNTFLSSGNLSPQSPIRLTTVEELHDIIATGTLRPGKDFEGRSGISAQLVDGKKPIVAYGPNDRISAAIVFPEYAAVGKGMAPNEVKVDSGTAVTDLRFVVDGFRELMTFDQLKEAVGEKQGTAGSEQRTVDGGEAPGARAASPVTEGEQNDSPSGETAQVAKTKRNARNRERFEAGREKYLKKRLAESREPRERERFQKALEKLQKERAERETKSATPAKPETEEPDERTAPPLSSDLWDGLTRYGKDQVLKAVGLTFKAWHYFTPAEQETINDYIKSDPQELYNGALTDAQLNTIRNLGPVGTQVESDHNPGTIYTISEIHPNGNISLDNGKWKNLDHFQFHVPGESPADGESRASADGEKRGIVHTPANEKTIEGRSHELRGNVDQSAAHGESKRTAAPEGRRAAGRRDAGGAAKRRGGGRQNHSGDDERPSGRPAVPGAGEGDEQSPARGAGDSGQQDGGVLEVVPVNYRITDDDRLGKGGVKQKARDNIAAIRILKQVTQEERSATPEEQAKLVKYVGWGASELANGIFEQSGYHPEERRHVASWFKAGWEDLGRELKDLLTPEEYQAAKKSTLNAHYTSDAIIRGMYDALQRLGFDGGRILEPGCGVGHFIGLLPESFLATSRFTGVELDHTSAAIARLLYPGHDIRNQGFEKFTMPDGFYDAAIGNPPFADIEILSDPAYARNRFKLHDYFFAKAMDKVRPGGLLMFVTSRYTMDKANDAARSYLSERADLLGAIRLPQTAFQENAGTEVVTDVLFLRKRAAGEQPSGEAWGSLKEIITPEGPANINEYFADHPEMVLGSHSLTGSMYGGNQYTVLPDKSSAIAEQFREAAANLPAAVYTKDKIASPVDRNPVEFDLAPSKVKEGAFYLDDKGNVLSKESGVGIPTTKKGKDLEILKSFVPLRNAVRNVLYVQIKGGDLAEAQQELTREYNAFVKKFGPINAERKVVTTRNGKESVSTRYPNFSPFRDDPDAYLIASIEKYDPETGKATPGPFFTERTIKPEVIPQINDITDALHVVLHEDGFVDITKIAAHMNVSEEQAIDALGGLIYHNPETGRWETDDQYLSGNVKKKLAVAENAAQADPKYGRNVQALQAVQPEDLPPSRISLGLGEPIISPHYVEQFAADVIGMGIKVSHLKKTGDWSVEKVSGYATTEATNDWGTGRKPAHELIDAALNSRQLRIEYTDEDGKKHFDKDATNAANEKLAKIKERFTDWVWEHPGRSEDLARKFNDTYNNTVKRQYGGSHIAKMAFPGMSAAVNPYDHQKRVAWRIVQSGNTYMAHSVGAGKTIGSILAGMELKRLGIKKKPCWVVPNHMLKQFASEFLQLYPSAKIIVADEQQFSKENRNRFMGRVAAENWDGVIITHSAFGKMQVSPEFSGGFITDQLRELEWALQETDKGDRLKRKQIERAKARLEQRLEKVLSAASKDKGVNFEETGIDQIFVDEAHEFRKLDFVTNQTNIKGIDPNGSLMAFDLYVKSRYLEKLYPGRSLVLMSGTPITNTIGEIFTIQRFLQEKTLEELGLDNFDAWSSTFGDLMTRLEATPAGNYKPVTRFAKFKKLATLSQLWGEIGDFVHARDLSYLKRPTVKSGGRIVVTAEQSSLQKMYKQHLAGRIKAIDERKRPPQKGDDILLSVITDGRHAALDERYIDPDSLPSPDNKLEKMVGNVFDIWEETKKDRLTQMIFCDLGMPGSEERRGFSAYKRIREALIAKGVPTKEIAFMQDYKKSDEKRKLFQAMNEGRVRVLIGSSEAMGTGVNAQKKLVALHHLDPDTYLPSNIEQREGRIVRQGNSNDEVRLYAYVNRGSYDETMWQFLETKQRFIDQFLAGDASTDEATDVDGGADSFAVARAMSSDNPLVLERAGVEADIQRLESLSRAHFDSQMQLRAKAGRAERQIPLYRKEIARLEQVIVRRTDTSGDKFALAVGSDTFTERKEAGEKLLAVVNGMLTTGAESDWHKVGEVAGLDIMARSGMSIKIPWVNLCVGAHGIYSNPVIWQGLNGLEEANPVGTAMKMENAARSFDRELAAAHEYLAKDEKLIDDSRERLGRPFEHAQALEDKRNRLREIEQILQAEERAEQGGADRSEYSTAIGSSTPAAKILSALKSALNLSRIPIRVVQSLSDLPAHIQDDMRLYGIEAIDGVFDPASNSMYLVADYIPSVERARELLRHEWFHAGVADKELEALYRYYSQKDMARLREIADERGFDLSTRSGRLEAAGELAAQLAETNPRNLLLARIVARIKEWLRALGLSVAFGQAEVARIIRDSIQRVQTGPERTQGVRAMVGSAYSSAIDDHDVSNRAQYSIASQDNFIMAHARAINAPAKVADMVRSLFELIGQNVPERLKANIGKVLSNPWFGSEGKPVRRKVVNLNIERSRNRTGIVSDLFQASEGYSGVEGLDNILKNSTKEERRQFNELIKYGDRNDVARTFTRDELYRGKTPFGELSRNVVEAYKIFQEVMQAANRVRFQQLDELSLLPYKDQPWFDALVELLNRNQERMADMSREEAGDFHRLVRSLKRGLTDEQLKTGENPAKVHATDRVIAAYRDFWAQVEATDKRHQGMMLSAFRDILGYRGELDKLKNEWGHLKGYAPRNRKDGDWHVSVYTTDDQGERIKVYMKPTLTEAGARRHVAEVRDNLEQYLKSTYDPAAEYEVEYERNQATPPELLAWKGSEVAVEALLNQAFDRAGMTGKMSVEEWHSLKHEVFQEIAKQIMAQGFGRHGISREKQFIEGYDDTDYQVVLKEYITGMAGWLSKMRFAIETTSAAKEISKADPQDKVWVNDYVQDAMKNGTYMDELAATARSVGAVWYLGFKVSSALLNGFQNYTVGQAELSRVMKRAGIGKSAVALLAKAQKDVLRDYSDRKRGGAGTLSEEERDVLRRAVREGTAQAQAVRMMSGSQEMGFGSAMKKATEYSMTPFAFVEQHINREPAILAAYRAFKSTAAGTFDAAAYQRAEEFVNNTHYVMGRENLPEIVRKLGPLGKTLYLFQGYTHNYLHWLHNRAKNGEFEAIARSFGAIAALGGVFALPGADDLDKWLTRWFGVSYKLKFKGWMRTHAREYGTPGEALEAFVNHGVASVGGVDMSRALAVNIPFVSDPDQTFGERVGGVWGGMLKKPGMAMNAAQKGDYLRALESVLPEFAANPLRAARQYGRGATTLSGKPILDEDGRQMKYGGMDVARKALGFQPLEISERTGLKNAEQGLSAVWNDERSDKLSALRVAHSQEQVRAAVQDIIWWNRSLQQSQARGLVLPISAASMQRARQFTVSKADHGRMQWERTYVE